jgi:hypothetical protein
MSRPKGIINSNRRVVVQSVAPPVIYDDMIANIMPKKGMSMNKDDLFDELKKKFGGNRHKASGAMGGGVNGGYIELNGTEYTVTRDAVA